MRPGFGILLFLALPVQHALSAEEAATPATETVVTTTTDSLDLTPRAQGPQKSAVLAMAASLILPGSGHEYLGRTSAGFAYISADVAAIFGYFFCTHYSQKLALDATGYAWIHSGAQASSSNTAYWNAVGSFMDVQDYDLVMNLNRTPNLSYPANQGWNWDAPSSQNTFNSLLSSSHRVQVVGDFMLGALIINRALAFIDVRAYTRNLQIRPQIGFSPQSLDVSLAASF
jgi:hypothetical protein